jgi:outer membrane protein W
MTITAHRFSVGVGLDASWLFFRKDAFHNAYPGVPTQVRDIWLIDLYLTSKYFFRPREQFSPYLGVDIGAHKTTSAEYRVVIDGVRTTYYYIPGSTRLAFGFTGGADYVVRHYLGFFLEVRGCYVHHDPDVGWTVYGRGGIELFL